MRSEEVCPKSPLASAVIVKNTFIDMEDENFQYDPRRSSSEPPTSRRRDQTSILRSGPLCGRVRRSKTMGDAASSTCSSVSPRETSAGAAESGSDDMTEERSHQGSTEFPSPSAGLNPNAPVWSPAQSPVAAPSWSPTMTMAGPPLTGPVFYQMPPPGSPVQAFGEPTLVAPPPPPPPLQVAGPPEGYPPVSSPGHHRLNANAKAWQPGAPMTMPALDGSTMMPAQQVVPPPPPVPKTPECLVSIPNSFRTQFEALLDSAKKALSNSTSVLGVDIFESSGTWGRGMNVMAWVRREDSGGRNRDQILKLAKDALMHTAEQSESAYIMGYRNRPFTTTEFGFAAVLAGMFDEDKACWESFTKGSCQRKWGTCRGQHPACQLPIHVEIRISCD